ncbi:MAG: PASTA domain-containing protein [Chloroflexia bacterium]
MLNKQTIEDRYEVEAFQASNGVVELYDGVDRQLSRPVTLQILREDAARDQALVRAFEEQQRTALSLYHCSVLAVYDLGVTDGRAFSVMERFNPVAPADFLHDGAAPDMDGALELTRQAAEGLQCCRESGLADWAFKLDMVGIDAEGNGRLAIIEGGGPTSEPQDAGDVAALGSLLLSLLTGRKEASREALDDLAIPSPVLSLLDRVETGIGAPPNTAGEFAVEIAAIQEAAGQPTQAYAPGAGIPAVGVSSPEAPTLAAPLISGAPVVPIETAATSTSALPVARPAETQALEPVSRATAHPVPGRERRAGRSILLWAGGLLALFTVAAVVIPRLAGGVLAAGTGGNAGQHPVPSPTAVPVVAPDLRGKSLEEAQILAEGYRLSIAIGPPEADAGLPPDSVVGQDPPAGTILHSGDVITVSLNLPWQAQPPPPTAVIPQPAEALEPPPNEGSANQDKDRGKNKGNNKNKDDKEDE